ncbi:MAG: hypothetical protein NTZ33_00180 [Bacteroidetes bacterium]|nr:hypothetical protein [Bacteroidota bacterium]
MKKIFTILVLFSLLIGCSKDDNLPINKVSTQNPLQIKKNILTTKTWYLSNKLCTDEAYHLNFNNDSVTQIFYQTFDFVTWYNSSNSGAYILTNDSIKFNRLFHYYGDNTLPYKISNDSLILYPTNTSYIIDKHIYVSNPIPGKP